jgi:hypothetical protein
MTVDLKLDTFKYFLEGYLNLSMDYADLEGLAKRYRTREKQIYINDLLNDLNLIIQLNDWEFIKQFVLEHGMRNLNQEKLKAMVNLLIKELSTEL